MLSSFLFFAVGWFDGPRMTRIRRIYADTIFVMVVFRAIMSILMAATGNTGNAGTAGFRGYYFVVIVFRAIMSILMAYMQEHEYYESSRIRFLWCSFCERL